SEIVSHMSELEKFVNVDEICDLDPLIKMALIHHQFESIHPFADGNGRVGRILNVLYLTKTGLLDIPILYLSRYVTHTKGDYYRLLQTVRDEDVWEDWILYMLAGVEETAQHALTLVEEIRTQMASVKRRMRDRLPKLYSQDLLNNLFRHPYTRVEFAVKDLGVTRQTAAKHLDKLADKGFVTKRSSGKHNYYVNDDLVELFVVG
ncbi:MAG: Fic family protein, partial [Roseovarius sp.]|nr:Fic family protein [Roseovarius sp.]